MLLNDDVLVSKYKKEFKEKDMFVRKVVEDWLSRNDGDPNDYCMALILYLIVRLQCKWGIQYCSLFVC